MSEKFNYIEHYKKDAEEFDYFEERTGATEDEERRVRESILSKIENGHLSILDVGSGSAWAAKAFENGNKKIISLDLSKNNVQKAKKLVSGKNHDPLVADSFFLPFKEGTFDIVIASEIIEHVVSPQDFIKEMHRVIKPGGKVIVTTPYKEKLRYFLCIHCNKKTPVNAHVHSFDEKLLNSFSPDSCSWETFGNKLLIYSRSYVILKYLPLKIWRKIDSLCNLFYNKPLHILVEYYK